MDPWEYVEAQASLDQTPGPRAGFARMARVFESMTASSGGTRMEPQFTCSCRSSMSLARDFRVFSLAPARVHQHDGHGKRGAALESLPPDGMEDARLVV